MAWDDADLTTNALDQDTDSLAAARVELIAAVNKINAIATAVGLPLGIVKLDGDGKIPAQYLPGGPTSGVDADTLDGEHGSFYRSASNLNAGTVPGARFADASHGSRSGGTLHAVATPSTAGFMSAADKQALDGRISPPTAGTTKLLKTAYDGAQVLGREGTAVAALLAGNSPYIFQYTGLDGTLRFEGRFRSSQAGYWSRLYIYKNGASQGSTQVTGTALATGTIDFTVSSGDVIEIYASSQLAGIDCYYDLLRFYSGDETDFAVLQDAKYL